MPKLKWKPVMVTRADGTSYLIGDETFNKNPTAATRILREIVSMPKQTPVSFADGYRIIGEHIEEIFDGEDGGHLLAEWLNRHGFFPEGLKALGYHIEIKETDFELV